MNQKAKKGTPGPQPERIKINVPWEDAVKQALGKPRPAGGWPKPEPKPRKGRKRKG